MFRSLCKGLLIISLLCGILVAAVWGGLRWWAQQPIDTREQAAPIAVHIPSGAGAARVAQILADARVGSHPLWLRLWLRTSGQDHSLQAGHYEIEPSATPAALLAKIVRGQQSLKNVTFVEGWTFAQMRTAIAKNPHLKQDIANMDEAAIMRSLGLEGVAAEGQFFPDTYAFAPGSSALAVLRSAQQAMAAQLRTAWALKAADSPLKTPQDLLILASIVEKETGAAADRALIAGVFTNRLRVGMRLQTDPTVIYGLGARFDGNLRRADLLADTPWNTYTRAGLPPTPIAMPGRAALMAAAQPATTNAIYFVARGDGSSHFSATLDEHNRAVNYYQRKIGNPP